MRKIRSVWNAAAAIIIFVALILPSAASAGATSTSNTVLAALPAPNTTVISSSNISIQLNASAPTGSCPSVVTRASGVCFGMRLSAAIGPMLSVLGSNSIYIVPQLMPQKKGNATDTAYNGSIPVPLPLSELPDLHSISHAQASAMVQSFSPYLGNDINSTVVMRNASMEVPYGYAMRNGTYAPTGSSLIYAAYSSNTTLSFYNATVSKAEPRLGINVAGATIDTPNMTSIIYVPVLPGRHTYSIQGMLNASLLAGNTANFTYSIRFGNGTVVNRTLGGSGLEIPFSFSNIPATENVTITFGTTGNSNYTAVDPTGIIIPTSISYYVPVTLANNQPYALPNPFQDMLTVNSLAYQSYEAANLDNIEFFYANGTIVPSWLESGNSNTATNTIYWLKVPGAFIPASSSNTLYMGFAANTVSLFGNTVTGEAPWLSSTYGQYDDGANVFDYYSGAPSSATGWTVSGSAGVTASAPSGSYFQTADAYYADSAGGDYMYTTATGLTTNTIITYWVYSTGLGDFFFLTNSAGSGQMSRLDTRGGSDWSGLAGTASWTSWSGPSSGLDESPNTWYKYDTVITPSTAYSYIGANDLGLSVLGTLANSYTGTDSGNYIGLVGDALGSSYVTYWNGMVIRAAPPSNTMPASTFGTVTSTSSPGLSMTSPTTYGSSDTMGATGNPATDTVELLIDNSIVAGPSVGTVSYTFNASLAPWHGTGSYTVNAYDTNSLLSTVGNLIVNKGTPSITLPGFPASFTYNGAAATITANIVTVNDQLTANDYVNGAYHASFTTQDSFTENAVGTYTITANTPGNGNYIAASVTKELLICPEVSSFPANIIYYSCIKLNNTQSANPPSPFQIDINVDSSKYQSYEAANLDNIEFFYANGTIVPSWLESGNSNTATNTIYWLKVPGSFLPASTANTVYMGFAANTVSLFNTQSTGEAPQLSSTYGQYDDGANVFDYYNVAPTSTAGWTVAGSAGVTASAPSGSYFQTTDALYANSANGDYLYTTAPGTSTNEILTYWVYTTKLGDVYFLDNSAGSGQMSRLGCGPGWLGITGTSSWKSWTAPPDAGPACSQWYKVDIAMNGASATMYYQSPLTPLGTYGHNPANTYSVTANGNYLGVVGDAAGAQFISYWNGFVARAYPPNGVMPTNISTTAAPVPPPSNTCTISLSPSGFAFGSLNPGTSIATTNSVTDTNSGNTNAYMYVYGSSWSGPGSFDVSNTSWSGSSSIAYGSANHLSSVPSNTLLLVPSGSGSNKIYWGLRVAPGAPTGTYSQTITIENSC